MISRLPDMTKWNSRIFALMVGASILGSLAPTTLAQEPIRVEANQVLVPVFVTDKERAWLLHEDSTTLWRAYSAGEMQLADDIVNGVVIHDLTGADFQVFEDGKEQAIQSLTFERSFYWNFRDNTGHHTEFIGPGGGKWSTAEWPPGVIGVSVYGHYLVAYALPESPEGSCHQIKVKVNRPNAMINARSEYCNTRHSALDPLNETTLGKQMQSDLASAKGGKVDVSLLAIPLYLNSSAVRVHIALDWPWKSLKHRYGSKTKGVLGMVFNKDGSLVARFSDFADMEGVRDRELFTYQENVPDVWGAENRYETQINLPPGEYDVRVVLSDGKRFGRAETSLTVDSYNRKDLAISAVSLCKQVSDASDYSSKRPPILQGSWTAKLPGNYVPLVSNDMEFKPTANTRFKKGETLYTYFEVYEPLLAEQSQATVQIKMRVVDLKTGDVMSDSQRISTTPYVNAGSPVIPIGRGIDISKLPKGSYRLDVQANDSTGKTTPWRSVNFTVE